MRIVSEAIPTPPPPPPPSKRFSIIDLTYSDLTFLRAIMSRIDDSGQIGAFAADLYEVLRRTETRSMHISVMHMIGTDTVRFIDRSGSGGGL